MSEYTVRRNEVGGWDLIHKDQIIIWCSAARIMSVPATPEQYKHLDYKPCTEAQALLILNQIKRELENGATILSTIEASS